MNAANYIEHFQTLAGALPGQQLSWLNLKRQAALAHFSASGFPSPREEEWKYTNVSPIEKKLFKPLLDAATPDDRLDRGWIEPLRVADAWSLVLIDGQFCPSLSVLDGIPEGVIACGMAQALSIHPERVAARFSSLVGQQPHGFIAFNTAFFTDGAFVDVPAHEVLDRPLQLLYLSTRPEGLTTIRSLISLGEHAQAQLVETFAGSMGLSHLTAAVTEISLSAHARLDHFKVQTESDKAYHFGGLYVSQARSSRFHQHNLAFGGLLVRNEIHTALRGGAECSMNGLFLAKGRQHVDNHTLIHHIEPQATSRESYRGVLTDRARGVFQGRIVVHPQAQKTQAEMNNRNLLLSEDAEIDTKPQLEILADDVKCAHGVTVGQLDPESVFYLESRGIDRLTARNMLTFAFANEMLEKIERGSLKALAQDQLLNLFPQTGIRRDWL